jgi:copper oxidase (laccase) domain-containing protein
MFELTKSEPIYGIAMPTRLSNYFIFCGDASELSGGRHHCGAERGCKADEAHAAPENVYRAEGLGTPHFFTTRNTPDSFMPEGTVTAKKQLHSTIVKYISDKNAEELHYCDGFVIDRESFDERGRYVAIRTADCVPILLYDPIAGVAGAVHAGWRGTVGAQGLPMPEDAEVTDALPISGGAKRAAVPGIAAEAVRVMCEHGADVGSIRVAIGACIHSCCFEVKGDFLDSVREELGATLAELTDRYTIIKEEKRYFDLPALNADLLGRVGIREENIMISPHCTCHEDEFYSFRRDGMIIGLLYAGIAL